MNDHIIVFNQICVSYLKSKMVMRAEHSLTYHLNYMYIRSTYSVFLSFVYLLLLEIQLSREGWDSIYLFNPAIFLCLSQARIWIPMSYVIVFSMFNTVWGDRLFCWYWWDCCPSLLNFHTITYKWLCIG